MSVKRHSKGFKLLASTSLLGLAIAATPAAVSIDWQDIGFSLQTAEAKSCFTPETQVLMADGSEKRICDIQVGDRVMSGEGRVNSVVAVERPRLDGRKLHAFNGGDFFVTAEHPFLTPAGWKAIDPVATAEENPALTVAALAVGDLLTVALPGGADVQGNLAVERELATSLMPLERIDSVAADPALRVYNLLLDGDHTYIANGFVVHNKGGEGGDDRGGNDRGGNDRGGNDRGGDDRGDSSGGERGDDGGEGGDDDRSGRRGGGELGEADDDHGEHGEDDDHGEHGQHAEDDDDSEHQGRGRGRGRGRGGDDVAGGDDSFGGEAGDEDASVSEDQEVSIIENGWQ